jgi:hypothetical protein
MDNFPPRYGKTYFLIFDLQIQVKKQCNPEQLQHHALSKFVCLTIHILSTPLAPWYVEEVYKCPGLVCYRWISPKFLSHFAAIVQTKEQSVRKNTNWMDQGIGGELCKYIQDKFI